MIFKNKFLICLVLLSQFTFNTFAGDAPPEIPQEEFQDWLMEKLIDAQPGDVITLPQGRYKLDAELSLTTNNVTIKGQGTKRTILSFKGQSSGAEGLLVTANNILIEDLTIEDTIGDGIKIMRSENIVLRNIKVAWTEGLKTDNGAYGLYPVQCKNILIEKSEVYGASDAGIYLGQSQNAIIRNNYAHHNVAGIEVENSSFVDVHDNTTYQNTAGILIFNLPQLSHYGNDVRVFNNKSIKNNGVNFADPANIVGFVPSGIGIMVMAYQGVELFDNELIDNQTTQILLSSYMASGRSTDDPNYYPFTEKVFIKGNKVKGGGHAPQGGSSEVSKQIIQILTHLLGKPFPTIIFDGATFNNQPLPSEKNLCISLQEKKEAKKNFVNLDMLGEFQNLSFDMKPFENCEHPRLKKIELPSLESMKL